MGIACIMNKLNEMVQLKSILIRPLHYNKLINYYSQQTLFLPKIQWMIWWISSNIIYEKKVFEYDNVNAMLCYAIAGIMYKYPEINNTFFFSFFCDFVLCKQ